MIKTSLRFRYSSFWLLKTYQPAPAKGHIKQVVIQPAPVTYKLVTKGSKMLIGGSIINRDGLSRLLKTI